VVRARVWSCGRDAAALLMLKHGAWRGSAV
jgi:hypothetical protein